MSFDLLKIKESIGIQLPKWESLGNVRVHSLTLSYTPRSMKCDSWPSFWPAPLQDLALVASPKLGLRKIMHVLFEVGLCLQP